MNVFDVEIKNNKKVSVGRFLEMCACIFRSVWASS